MNQTALMSRFKKVLPNRIVTDIKNIRNSLLILSIHETVQEQVLSGIIEQLTTIVPDIMHQYSTYDLDSDYLKTNVRAVHAFQIYLVNQALQPLIKNNITIIDIGDSAGTHIRYLQNLYRDYKIRFLSVNLDETAVDKIKSMGLEAICCRAEELTEYSIDADIFLSFEMLEHLMNPSKFLKDLSDKTACKRLVVTVPYISNSRVGLHHIRGGDKNKKCTPENTHIFELSPLDWKLIFMHSGWKILSEKIYLQYPKKGLLHLMKGYWKKNDFEGFYGAVLMRDHSWSQMYNGC